MTTTLGGRSICGRATLIVVYHRPMWMWMWHWKSIKILKYLNVLMFLVLPWILNDNATSAKTYVGTVLCCRHVTWIAFQYHSKWVSPISNRTGKTHNSTHTHTLRRQQHRIGFLSTITALAPPATTQNSTNLPSRRLVYLLYSTHTAQQSNNNNILSSRSRRECVLKTIHDINDIQHNIISISISQKQN